jgi:hypothetical protein
MEPNVDPSPRTGATLCTLRLWLVFLSCAGVTALLIAALQRASEVLPASTGWATAASTPAPGGKAVEPGRPPPAAFAPTFASAAGSLRVGRNAEAYGRFVALADDGDVDAARFALLMHRYGPTVFGSAWDASPEQVADWARWSARAAEEELAEFEVLPSQADPGKQRPAERNRNRDRRPGGGHDTPFGRRP